MLLVYFYLLGYSSLVLCNQQHMVHINANSQEKKDWKMLQVFHLYGKSKSGTSIKCFHKYRGMNHKNDKKNVLFI